MSMNDGSRSAQVGSLWRYPVKSMRGESCSELRFESGGVSGDRSFGVLDLRSGTVVSAKREGRLLGAVANLSSGELVVELPDGQILPQTFIQGSDTRPGRVSRRMLVALAGTAGEVDRRSQLRGRNL